MSDEVVSNEVPVTQGEQQPVQTAESTQASESKGIQKRIDELTARYHDTERVAQRMLAEKDAQIKQLTDAILTRTQAPPQPDVLEGVDPTDVRRVETIVERKVSAQMKRLEELTHRMESQLQTQNVRQYARQTFDGDNRVEELAAQLQQDWSKRGLNGWSEQDAAYMAAGLVAAQDRQEAQKAKGKSVSAHPSTTVISNQTVPSAPQRTKDPLAGVDIDALMQTNPAKAAQLLEQKLAGKKW